SPPGEGLQVDRDRAGAQEGHGRRAGRRCDRHAHVHRERQAGDQPLLPRLHENNGRRLEAGQLTRALPQARRSARTQEPAAEPGAGRVEEGSGMPDIIWVEARRRLRGELLDKDYDTWIAPLRAARWSADTLALEAPSGFARDWLRQHFLPALERAVTEASGAPATVLLLVNRELSIPARAGALPGHRAA